MKKHIMFRLDQRIIFLIIMIISIFISLSGCRTFPVSAPGSIELFMDGSLADRIYELGTPIQARVDFNATTDVCIDVLDGLYGTNFSCGTTDGGGDYLANLSIPLVSVNNFNDSSLSKGINESLIGYLPVNNRSEYVSFTIDINGSGQLNTSIDICNDGDAELVLPGYQYNSMVEIRNYTDDTEEITFTDTDAAILKFVSIPNSILFTYDGFFNFTPSIFFFQYTEDFDTTEFKETDANTDGTYFAIWNTTEEKAHIAIDSYSNWTNEGLFVYSQTCCSTTVSSGADNTRDKLNTTKLIWERQRDAYSQGPSTARTEGWRFSTRGHEVGTVMNIPFYCRVLFGGSFDTGSSTFKLRAWNVDTDSWDDFSGSSGCGCGGITCDTGAITGTASLTLSSEYVNTTSTNEVRIEIHNTIATDDVVNGFYNTTYRLHSGLHGQKQFNSYTTVLTYTTQSITLYTPADNITSIRLNITSEETSNANFSFFLTADGGTNWEEVDTHNALTNYSFTNQGKDMKFKIDFSTSNQNETANITLVEFPDQIGTTQPSNVTIDIGNDGTNEYESGTGVLGTSISFNITNNTGSIINFINSDDCSGDDCSIPILFFSKTRGVLTTTLFNLSYSNMDNLNVFDDCIENFCTNSSCNLPLNISPGTTTASDLRLGYNGHKNVTIRAHNSDNSSTDSSLAIIYYSGWNYSFKPGVSYLEFIPRRPSDKNISAFGQSTDEGILNFTSRNFDIDMNFSILLNETFSCVDLFIGITGDKASAINLSANADAWNELFADQSLFYTQETWMWADFDCNATEWMFWEPELFFRGCAVGSICDEATS